MKRLSTWCGSLLLLSLPALAQAESGPRGFEPTVVHAAAASSGTVNLNEASPEELERLPGIGPAKAKAIVDHRKAHPFKKPEEITKVKGIGRKTFGRLRAYLTLAGPTTLKESARASK